MYLCLGLGLMYQSGRLWVVLTINKFYCNGVTSRIIPFQTHIPGLQLLSVKLDFNYLFNNTSNNNMIIIISDKPNLQNLIQIRKYNLLYSLTGKSWNKSSRKSYITSSCRRK